MLAGAVILTLIIILSIRERRYEIGVLWSLGENRLRLSVNFRRAFIIVTLVSLVIAIVAGSFVVMRLETSTTITDNFQVNKVDKWMLVRNKMVRKLIVEIKSTSF